jgi:hypothetical protein
MRVFTRIAVVILAVVVLSAPTLLSQPLQAGCPLTLMGTNPASTPFYQSPHGVFRYGSLVYVLRGQTLTTYNVTDLGDLQIAREDFIGTLSARESNGGVVFLNGFMGVSSEAGLEIFDLRNVRAGGSAPLLVATTPGLHYRRLAFVGNLLAGLFPATDMPCYVGYRPFCTTSVDLIDVSNPASPVVVGSLSSSTAGLGGFNDIATSYGALIVTGNTATAVFDISNPAQVSRLYSVLTPGTFLVSNGANFFAVGNDGAITTYLASANSSGSFSTAFPLTYHSLATLQHEHSNPIMFHPQGFIDDQTAHLITMVDERDPQTLQSARTFAFDVFDYGVPMYEGRDPRVYEQVSYTIGEEVKYNPVAVGPFVYVVGEVTGLQTYGACGKMAGRIEWSSTSALPCGGSEIHGWVTGATKIANVEVFLDGGSLGSASLTGAPRTDIASTTPVQPWRIAVNLDATASGVHILSAVGTDISGNRLQFASQRILFGGPGKNCFTRRRISSSP